MAAVGNGFSSSQYSTNESTALATTTQTFTGSIAKDALGRGVGDMFLSIKGYWDGLMNSEVDRVMVPSGRSIRIVIREPIVLKTPKSNVLDYSEVDNEFFY